MLHERISHDVAELRARYGRGPNRRRRRSGDLLTVAVEVFRVMQAAQSVVAALRPATPVLGLLTAWLRRRRSR
jgi:hypothetical protein